MKEINMKFKTKILLAGAATFLFAGNLVANDAQKEAFDMGMKSAIKVMKYEREQAFKPIPAGYCIEVKTVDDKKTNDFSAIKLESLSLYMGLKPSLLEITNIQGKKEKTLCFAMTEKTRGHAESILKKIKKDYPKIDSFFPHVVHIPNPRAYTRIVPGIGELFEDKTNTIIDLIKNTEKRARGYENELKVEKAKIKQLESKLSRISVLFSKGEAEVKEFSSKTDEASVETKTVEKKTVEKNTTKPSTPDNTQVVEIDKNPYGLSKEGDKKNKSNIKPFTNGKQVSKNSKYPIISSKDTDLRFQDKERGLSVEMADRDNPRILKVKSKKATK